MIKPTIGTVSHGTLGTEDLIETFRDELDRLCGATACGYADLLTESREWLATYEKLDDLDGEHDERGSDLVDELTEALNELAPPYCYFGAREGDGSDFGFWPLIESLEEDARNGEVLKVSDLSEVPEGNTLPVMLVNDHGNVTLYLPTITLAEAWACV